VVYFLDDAAPPVEGRVVREDASIVIVEVQSGRVTFPRLDVRQIVRRPWEPKVAAAPAAPAPPVPAPRVAPAPPPTAAPAVRTAAPPSPQEIAAAAAKVGAIAPRLAAITPDERAAAVAEVRALGPAAAPAAADLIRAGSLPPDARAGLLRLLGDAGLPETLPALAAALSDSAGEVVDEALAAAACFGPAAAPLESRINTLLDGRPPDATAALAARALGAFAGEDGLTALAARLQSSSPRVREAIVRSLVGRDARGRPVLAVLESTVFAPDAGVRRDALAALAALERDYRLFPDLAGADPSAAVRVVALGALGGAADDRSLEILLRALAEPSADVVAAAASALGERRETRAIFPLISTLPGAKGYALSVVHGVLRALTGENLPPTAYAWRRWWEEGGGRQRFGVP
jgi:HEAT repeat protein